MQHNPAMHIRYWFYFWGTFWAYVYAVCYYLMQLFLTLKTKQAVLVRLERLADHH